MTDSEVPGNSSPSMLLTVHNQTTSVCVLGFSVWKLWKRLNSPGGI